MSNCVFAGSFDPITNGHINVIEKCIDKYDKVFIVLGENKEKKPLFSQSVRLAMIKSCIKSDKVIVVSYGDIKDYTQFLKDNDLSVYIRGIRNDEDIIYEDKYKEINKKLYPFVETVYISADEKVKDISSTLIRDRILSGQPISGLVPKSVEEIIKSNKR